VSHHGEREILLFDEEENLHACEENLLVFEGMLLSDL
jgi:hypothetical protein